MSYDSDNEMNQDNNENQDQDDNDYTDFYDYNDTEQYTIPSWLENTSGLFSNLLPLNLNNIGSNNNFYYHRRERQPLFSPILVAAMNQAINSFTEDIILETVLQTSLNDTTLSRSDRVINFNSQRYDTILDELKKCKDCSICLVDFEDEDMVSIPRCNHVFHTNCIEESSRYKNSCPNCRTTFEEDVEINEQQDQQQHPQSFNYDDMPDLIDIDGTNFPRFPI
jgi:hypothetical protein